MGGGGGGGRGWINFPLPNWNRVKSHTKKKQSFTLSLEDTFLEKPHGGHIDPLPLLKRDPRTGVSQPAVSRSSTKWVFLNNSQNIQENTCVEVSYINFRGSCSQMSFKIVVLKNFANFTRKHLYWSLFLNKVAGLQNCNFIKKTSTQVFSSEVCEIFKTTFFYRTSPMAASDSFKSPA